MLSLINRLLERFGLRLVRVRQAFTSTENTLMAYENDDCSVEFYDVGDGSVGMFFDCGSEFQIEQYPKFWRPLVARCLELGTEEKEEVLHLSDAAKTYTRWDIGDLCWSCREVIRQVADKRRREAQQ